MTWTWLFVWNASWFIWALLWLSLQAKLGGDPPQGYPGRNKLERREVEAPRTRRSCRAPRFRRS
jgi:hypothetical protein